MSNLLKLTPENYYTKEANMQYVSVSQYKEFNGTTGKMGCEAYAMAKLRGEVEEVTTTALMVVSYCSCVQAVVVFPAILTIPLLTDFSSNRQRHC